MSAPTLPALLFSHWGTTWSLDIAALGAAGIYLCAVRRVRSPWPRRRMAAFLAGVACVVVALQSGIDAYDDRLLSVHMVQHMVLLLVAPPLLLSGQPVILALRALRGAPRTRVAHALIALRPLTSPVACIAAFDVVVLATHLPTFYDATLHHPLLHQAEHLLYLLAGTLLCWPLLGGEPARSRRLGGLGRTIYMLAAMPAMALIGAYLNRNPTLVYPSYGPAGHALGISALTDQAQAGAIMWVAGSVVITVVGIWSAIAALAAEERRQQLADARASTGAAFVPAPSDPGQAS